MPSKSSRVRPMSARSDSGCACASAPSAKKPSTPAVPRSMRTGSCRYCPTAFRRRPLSPGARRTLSATFALPGCAAGADGDAAACRARSPQRTAGNGIDAADEAPAGDDRRRLADRGAALAEREARVDAGRQHLVGVEHVPVADGEPAEGRQRRLLAIGLLLLLLAELPRGAAVGAALEVGVERRRLEPGDVQRRAVPGAPEVEVAELQRSRRARAACAASGSTSARRSRSRRRGRGRCRAGRCERPRRARRSPPRTTRRSSIASSRCWIGPTRNGQPIASQRRIATTSAATGAISANGQRTPARHAASGVLMR